MADMIQVRRDTAALWVTTNPILASGEFGHESDTGKLKIGDGTTTWTSLAYFTALVDGITSTTAELNILDGVTSTAAELNILDGVTSTAAELNYVDGVTSNIQTQLNAAGSMNNVVEDTTPQLGGNLDVQSSEITTSTSNGNIKVTPNGSGVFEVKGAGGGDGTLQLNCSANTHGVKIKSPPHSAAASYTLTLPNNDGDANQMLQTNGSGVLTWASTEASDLTFVGRTSNTQLGASNKGNFINVTANSFTQTFDTPANLGAGWWCTIKNSGSGIVTVQPGTLGSELLQEGNLSTLATGGELAVNNTFSSDSNWTKSNGSVTISGGTATWTGSANLTQSGSSVIQAGRMYLCTYTVTAHSSGNIQIGLGQETSQGGASVGTHYRVLISENTETIKLESSNFNGSITDISVKLITNWRAGRADGQRDQWRYNDPTESDSGLYWWTNSLPVYNANSGQPDGNWIGQPVSLTAGNAYRLSIDIKSTGSYAATSRWVPILTGGATLQLGGLYADGTLTTKTWDFTATGNHTLLQICCLDNAQQGVLDNWSLKSVTADIDGAVTLPILPEREARISTDGTNFYAGPRAIPNFEAKLLLNCDKNGNIEYQKNVSSITDTATGQLTVTVDNDFNRTDYVVSATAEQGTGVGHLCTIKESSKSGGSFMVLTHSGDYQDTASDPDRYNIVAFGE